VITAPEHKVPLKRRRLPTRSPVVASLTGAVSAALLVLLVLLGEWFIWSVSFHDAALYLAYELGFTLLPGVLAYVVLTGRAALGLEQVAIGWALGFALELIAFVVTASTGHRSLFVLYPVVVGVLTIPFLLSKRRVRRERLQIKRRGWIWALALVQIIVLVYFAEQSFSISPPPQSVPEVSYYQDKVLFVSLAAEAVHHWPLQDPQLAGTALHYHYFYFLHEAAVHQVTGISLFQEEFRLCLPVLALLVLLQFAYAGRVFARSPASGVVGGTLFFLISSFDPFPTVPSDLFPLSYLSGTFLFGLALFLPAVTEMGVILRGATERNRFAHWIVAFVLLGASAGSKGSIPPVVLGGLVLLGLFALVRDRVLLWKVVGLGLGAAAIYALSRLTIYRDTGAEFPIHPLYILGRELPAILIVLAIIAVVFAWRDRRRSRRAIALVSAIAFLVFAALIPDWLPHAGVTYGFNPFEWGIVGEEQPFKYLHQFIPDWAPFLGVFWTIAVVFATLKLLLALIPGLLGVWVSRREQSRTLVLWLLALLLSSLVPFYAFVLAGDSQVYFLAYGYAAGCVLAGAGLVALWKRYVGPVAIRAVVAGGLVVLLLLIWSVDRPLESSPKNFWQGLTKGPLPGCCDANMTPGLYAGLRWLSHNSSPNDVLAVNDQYQDLAGLDPRNYNYAAFAERRVMLGGQFKGALVGPFYPPKTAADAYPTTTPFPTRVRLNNAIFQRADRAALTEAKRRYGVRYLVASKLHGATPEQLKAVGRLGRIVFDNSSVEIISV
jgi:hypothetical protein